MSGISFIGNMMTGVISYWKGRQKSGSQVLAESVYAMGSRSAEFVNEQASPQEINKQLVEHGIIDKNNKLYQMFGRANETLYQMVYGAAGRTVDTIIGIDPNHQPSSSPNPAPATENPAPPRGNENPPNPSEVKTV